MREKTVETVPVRVLVSLRSSIVPRIYHVHFKQNYRHQMGMDSRRPCVDGVEAIGVVIAICRVLDICGTVTDVLSMGMGLRVSPLKTVKVPHVSRSRTVHRTSDAMVFVGVVGEEPRITAVAINCEVVWLVHRVTGVSGEMAKLAAAVHEHVRVSNGDSLFTRRITVLVTLANDERCHSISDLTSILYLLLVRVEPHYNGFCISDVMSIDIVLYGNRTARISRI